MSARAPGGVTNLSPGRPVALPAKAYFEFCSVVDKLTKTS